MAKLKEVNQNSDEGNLSRIRQLLFGELAEQVTQLHSAHVALVQTMEKQLAMISRSIESLDGATTKKLVTVSASIDALGQKLEESKGTAASEFAALDLRVTESSDAMRAELKHTVKMLQSHIEKLGSDKASKESLASEFLRLAELLQKEE